MDAVYNTYPVAAFMLAVFLLAGRGRKLIFILFSLISFIACAIEMGHILLYGAKITRNTYFSILATNPDEAREFATEAFFSGAPVVTAITAVRYLAGFIFLYKKLTDYRPGFKNACAAACVILLIITGGAVYKTYAGQSSIRQWSGNAAGNAATSYYLYRTEIARLKNYDRLKNKKLDAVSLTGEKQTYVLVIGESASRVHMGVYGYKRDTTPYFSKLNEAGELYVFKDVISRYSLTYQSLKAMFSLEDIESGLTLYDGSLIELMKQAGFKTYWISTQVLFEANNLDIPGIFVNEADVAHMLTKDGSGFMQKNASYYDGKILPYLEKALDDKAEKKFIVIHLMGSHFIYKYRYPPEFGIFDGQSSGELQEDRQNTINNYDNSIRYTDYILETIIKMLKAQNGLSYMLYLSDHGETVYDTGDTSGHLDTTNFEPDLITIPFTLWISRDYRNAFPAETNRWTAYLCRSYQSDKLIYSLATLSHVNFKSNLPEKSIFSEQYQQFARHYGNFDYDKHLQDWYNEDPERRTPFLPGSCGD